MLWTWCSASFLLTLFSLISISSVAGEFKRLNRAATRVWACLLPSASAGTSTFSEGAAVEPRADDEGVCHTTCHPPLTPRRGQLLSYCCTESWSHRGQVCHGSMWRSSADVSIWCIWMQVQSDTGMWIVCPFLSLVFWIWSKQDLETTSPLFKFLKNDDVK